jgi:hypothetical protein
METKHIKTETLVKAVKKSSARLQNAGFFPRLIHSVSFIELPLSIFTRWQM